MERDRHMSFLLVGGEVDWLGAAATLGLARAAADRMGFEANEPQGFCDLQYFAMMLNSAVYVPLSCDDARIGHAFFPTKFLRFCPPGNVFYCVIGRAE